MVSDSILSASGRAQAETVFLAARKCLRFGIPFAVCHLPGNQPPDFFCGIESSADNTTTPSSSEAGKTFEIGRWLAPWSERTSIGQHLSASQAALLEEADAESYPGLFSTPEALQADNVITREEYHDAVAAITERCRLREGKTVYSRVISGENPSLDIPAAARMLFDAFPSSFGFLYYTPQTGCWLGASPETLLDFDAATRRVSTMAFAGTRQASAGDTPWDAKNLRENRFVADYIRDRFRMLGMEPKISRPYTVSYGVIQHLRRNIQATLPKGLEFHCLLDLINPTPALCGTPLAAALEDIRDFERHKRGCYGGFVGIRHHHPSPACDDSGSIAPGGFRSFVNLRSARISPLPGGYFEILAGGGLLQGSDPASEWAETESKASRLLSILSGRSF